MNGYFLSSRKLNHLAFHKTAPLSIKGPCKGPGNRARVQLFKYLLCVMRTSVAEPWATSKSHVGTEENWSEMTKAQHLQSYHVTRMWREGQNQWHAGYKQKTRCNKGCTAVGLLGPSSVDMAMNFSLPRALVYAQRRHFNLSLQQKFEAKSWIIY